MGLYVAVLLTRVHIIYICAISIYRFLHVATLFGSRAGTFNPAWLMFNLVDYCTTLTTL